MNPLLKQITEINMEHLEQEAHRLASQRDVHGLDANEEWRLWNISQYYKRVTGSEMVLNIGPQAVS